MRTGETCARLNIDREVLEGWVAEGWLLPAMVSGEPDFAEIDVARAHLIIHLREAAGVNDEGVGIILDLVDQLQGLRVRGRQLLAALNIQPVPVGRRVARDAVRLSCIERAHLNRVRNGARGDARP